MISWITKFKEKIFSVWTPIQEVQVGVHWFVSSFINSIQWRAWKCKNTLEFIFDDWPADRRSKTLIKLKIELSLVFISPLPIERWPIWLPHTNRLNERFDIN